VHLDVPAVVPGERRDVRHGVEVQPRGVHAGRGAPRRQGLRPRRAPAVRERRQVHVRRAHRPSTRTTSSVYEWARDTSTAPPSPGTTAVTWSTHGTGSVVAPRRGERRGGATSGSPTTAA